MSERQKMIKALEEYAVPALQQQGFSGGFPHYYRKKNDRYDLVEFEMHPRGNMFWVDVSYVFTGKRRINNTLPRTRVLNDKDIEDNNMINPRRSYRLKGNFDNEFYYVDVYKTGRWPLQFYEAVGKTRKKNYNPGKGSVKVQNATEGIYKQVSLLVAEQLPEAMRWLAKHPSKWDDMIDNLEMSKEDKLIRQINEEVVHQKHLEKVIRNWNSIMSSYSHYAKLYLDNPKLYPLLKQIIEDRNRSHSDRVIAYSLFETLLRNFYVRNEAGYLYERLEKETDESMQSIVLGTIASTKMPEEIEPEIVFKMTGAKKEVFSNEAYSALGSFDNETSREFLRSSLGKLDVSDDKYRLMAIIGALERIGDASDLAMLEQFSSSRKEELRLTAQAAIENIKEKTSHGKDAKSNFSVFVKDLEWINGNKDDPDDLCLHGLAIATIGDRVLEYDAAVSATALYLLKTLTEDHIIYEDNQMLPCCGFFMIPDEKQENVSIVGCDNGIDWSVIHENDTVRIILEDGYQVVVPMESYVNEVIHFADYIEEFYSICTPKNVPEDDRGNAYRVFWNEWHRRRNQYK